MSLKTITIYQAMVDLKLMKKQLDNMISELNNVLGSSTNPFNRKDNIMTIPFVAIKTKAGTELGGVDIEEYKSGLQSNFDKYDSLISNIEAYSAAIAQSNAVTKVTIAGKEYTVAEAIKKKELSTARSKFLTLIKKQVSFASYAVINKNAEIEKNWLDTLKTISKDGTLELAEEFIEKQKQDFYDKNTYELVDPMNLMSKIDSLINEHDMFLNEVDTVLTTSNVQTVITFELED